MGAVEEKRKSQVGPTFGQADEGGYLSHSPAPAAKRNLRGSDEEAEE